MRVSAKGFTLLEVMVGVMILAISLTSLLESQMAALRATRYAQRITAVAFLAEWQLHEVEWELKQDGWGDADKEFEGDFSEQGWPDVTYECLVDMIEMPDYQQLVQAKDAADTEGAGNSLVDVQDAGEQAFDSLGLVWPMVKGAVEQSIRRTSCTVFWEDKRNKGDNDDPDACPEGTDCFKVSTFWTDVAKLSQLPQAGGEVGEEGDTDEPGGGGGGGRGGAGPPGRPGGVNGPGAGPGSTRMPSGGGRER